MHSSLILSILSSSEYDPSVSAVGLDVCQDISHSFAIWRYFIVYIELQKNICRKEDLYCTQSNCSTWSLEYAIRLSFNQKGQCKRVLKCMKRYNRLIFSYPLRIGHDVEWRRYLIVNNPNKSSLYFAVENS